jgi:putative transposase
LYLTECKSNQKSHEVSWLYGKMIEEDKYKNKYRTTPARLNGWDYGANGLYFVTICTKDKTPFLGEIVETQSGETHSEETRSIVSLRETEIGQVAYHNWLQIPEYAPFVELDEFVIMPDHLHGILYINKPDKIDWQPNKFGGQSKNLASIIRGYKSSVKTYATHNLIDFMWQPKYYDRVIRDEKEHNNIRQYIYDNPEQWLCNKGVVNENYSL